MKLAEDDAGAVPVRYGRVGDARDDGAVTVGAVRRLIGLRADLGHD